MSIHGVSASSQGDSLDLLLQGATRRASDISLSSEPKSPELPTFIEPTKPFTGFLKKPTTIRQRNDQGGSNGIKPLGSVSNGMSLLARTGAASLQPIQNTQSFAPVSAQKLTAQKVGKRTGPQNTNGRRKSIFVRASLSQVLTHTRALSPYLKPIDVPDLQLKSKNLLAQNGVISLQQSPRNTFAGPFICTYDSAKRSRQCSITIIFFDCA